MKSVYEKILAMKLPILLPITLVVMVLGGCRGMDSENAPIHPNLNMDFQPKYQAMGASGFFEDGRAMRPPVPGTVARGLLRDDAIFYTGRTDAGGFTTSNPMPITMELLERGQERYNIYCTVCHSASGDGRGIIMTGQYGYTPAPSFHDERIRQMDDGELYDIVTNGIRNMPGYGTQIAVADRWAVVAYVRALQRSQDASLADVPESQRGQITPGEAPPESPQPELDIEGADVEDQDADTTDAE